MNSPSAAAKEEAATALISGVPAAVPAIIESTGLVMTPYGRALVRSMGEPAVEPLVELLNETNDRAAQMQIIIAIGAIGPPAVEAADELLPKLESEHADIRIAVCDSLGLIKPSIDMVRDTLLKALSDSDGRVVQSAAYTLGRIGVRGDERITDALRRRFGEEHNDCSRVAIACALIKLDAASEDMRMLIEREARTGPYYDANTYRALAELGDAGSLRLLDSLIFDQNNVSRQAALMLLEWVQPSPQVIDILIKALDDTKLGMLSAAVLWSYGQAAADALPALRAVAGGRDRVTDQGLRLAAECAILHITAQTSTG
jgi:HEAT repeat protein